MRHVALAMLVAACGGGGDKPQDAPTEVKDAPGSTTDAPPLPACTPKNGTTVSVRKVTQISGSALLVASPPNDGRLFVVMQDGRIMIVENEQAKTTPFLDLSNTNLTSDVPQGERGLLGLAFSPNYATDRAFYVFYTANANNMTQDVLARYHASATDPYVAETTGDIIFSIPDFAGNHNGGMIEFGKDGYLYIGTGDGGGAGDPRRNAQALTRSSNTEPLLGKILRIDVNTTNGPKNYGIPSDNPFMSSDVPEAFVTGVRNPWRWSFDKMTGDMWIADVGQDQIEELDVLKDGDIKGKNLGWSMYEANNCFGNYTCDPAGKTMPQFTKNHTPVGQGGDGWLAIIGGEVYRGTCFPDLAGTYFMTDNTRHALTTAKLESNGSVTATVLPNPTGGWPTGPSSIHADARGELYMTTTNGTIYQIEAGP